MSERDNNGSPAMTQALCEARMQASLDDRRRLREEMKEMQKEFDDKLIKACLLQTAEFGKQISSMKAYIAGAFAATTAIITLIMFILNLLHL